MPGYRLELSYTRWYTVEVEADSYADAEEIFDVDCPELEDDGSRVDWKLIAVEEKLENITRTDK
tara:strand:- start:1611 stop:1802 length:192 start_codon:yes stop_codon:yes gene_type:complete